MGDLCFVCYLFVLEPHAAKLRTYHVSVFRDHSWWNSLDHLVVEDEYKLAMYKVVTLPLYYLFDSYVAFLFVLYIKLKENLLGLGKCYLII